MISASCYANDFPAAEANQALRKLFQLYANVRPAKYLEGAIIANMGSDQVEHDASAHVGISLLLTGVCSKFPGADIVVVRNLDAFGVRTRLQ